MMVLPCNVHEPASSCSRLRGRLLVYLASDKFSSFADWQDSPASRIFDKSKSP